MSSLFDPQWLEWSAQRLAECADGGTLVINPLIYTEISVGFNQVEELEAAFLAGQRFLEYRRRGGDRRSPIPDFYIGVDAEIT